jgi:hypothetical protein
MPINTQATVEDLYHVRENGKAEIVNGEPRLMAPTEGSPGAADEVFVSLRAHARLSRATDPDSPKVYRRRELDEAGPAVPGWTMPVEDLYA